MTEVLVATDTAGSLTPADQSAIEVLEERAPIAACRFIGGCAVSVDDRVYPGPGAIRCLTGSVPILVDQQVAAVSTDAIVVLGSIRLIVVLLVVALRAVLAPCVVAKPLHRSRPP